MSNKQMVIHASVCSSTDECGMEITETEWNKLSDNERSGLIREVLPNICDIYVAPEEEGEL